MCLCPTHAHFKEEEINGKKNRVIVLDPVEIEFTSCKVKIQTKEYFEEGASNIRIERNILDITGTPSSPIYLDEYITACYGTTEYPEDMNGITLAISGGKKQSINYEYKCRNAKDEKATEVSAVIPKIETKVSLTPSTACPGYIQEGYAFSPMFKLGFKKEISNKEVFSTWLNLAKAN